MAEQTMMSSKMHGNCNDAIREVHRTATELGDVGSLLKLLIYLRCYSIEAVSHFAPLLTEIPFGRDGP